MGVLNERYIGTPLASEADHHGQRIMSTTSDSSTDSDTTSTDTTSENTRTPGEFTINNSSKQQQLPIKSSLKNPSLRGSGVSKERVNFNGTNGTLKSVDSFSTSQDFDQDTKRLLQRMQNEISDLQNENMQLKTDHQVNYEQYESKIADLNEQNTDLNTKLNSQRNPSSMSIENSAVPDEYY